MRIYIVIPCYNEGPLIKKTLKSLVNQTRKAEKIVVVNDNSTDNSEEVIETFANTHSYISLVNTHSTSQHQPGSKVINAFKQGLETLDDNYDVICKFDADLIFPENYLETIEKEFLYNPTTGLAGGFCYIEKKGNWELENLTNKDHLRGALKAYRKECFESIGGLKSAMGWDTADELLAQFHRWEIKTLDNLKVKHLKPTGNIYNKEASYLQGEAFYRLHYGLMLTAIAAFKLALRKGNIKFLFSYLHGYFRAKRIKKEYLVSTQEGQFIRKLRWKGILKKLTFS